MDKIEKLQQDAVYAARRAQEISDAVAKEERPMSAEEERQIMDYLQESESLEAQIKGLKRTQDLQNQVDARFKASSQPDQRRGVSPSDIEQEQRAAPRIEFPIHSGKLKAFANTPEGREKAYHAGMWVRAAMLEQSDAARFLERNAPHVYQRAMSGTINSSGGALVPDAFANEVIMRRDEYGVFPGLAQIIPMPSDVYGAPKSLNSTTATWDGERGTQGETDPSLLTVGLTARKLKAFTQIPTELAEDATIAIGDFVIDELGWAFAQKIDASAINGAAGASNGGINGLIPQFETANLAGAIDAASGVDTPEEVTNTDLNRLMGSLRDYAYKRGTPVFLCSRTYAHLIFGRLKSAAGGNTIETLNGGVGDNYLGYPIVISEEMPKATTGMNNKAMVLFGNFGASTMIGTRREMRVENSRDHNFTQDQITIMATQRLDINHHDLGNTTDTGSVVALIGQS